MKTKILLMAALGAGFLFSACSKDDSVTTEVTFGTYVGQGTDSYTGSAAPVITLLHNEALNSASELNESLKDFSVTGKGKNEEEALADAKTKAIDTYTRLSESVVLQMINIRATFEANRKLNAAAILAEPEPYRTKITLVFYLVERTGEFQDPIIKQSDSYYMEAIAGKDYSQ